MPLLSRLDARDRALFSRLALAGSCAPSWRATWTLVTHLGGARASIALAVAPALLGVADWRVAWHALLLLGVSHLVVQVVKRCVVRERPTARLSIEALIAVPDRFSFPSGHACAAMAVALAYAWVFPWLGAMVLVAALLVGGSRVRSPSPRAPPSPGWPEPRPGGARAPSPASGKDRRTTP
jgi:undecaprenyl-diphosphatase